MGSRKAPYFCIASYPTRVPDTQQTRCLRQSRGLHGLTEACRDPAAYDTVPEADEA
jgi:hypothetical protein